MVYFYRILVYGKFFTIIILSWCTQTVFSYPIFLMIKYSYTISNKELERLLREWQEQEFLDD